MASRGSPAACAFIRSEEGSGTTVECTVPAARARCARRGSRRGRAGRAGPELKSRHILVVEDDPDVRRVIVECLGLIGYR